METIIVGELPVDEVKTIIDCCREDLSDCENIKSPEFFVSTKPPLSSIPVIEVIPETVGMFTGKLDKNGKEIYGSIPINGKMSKGGDIVKLSENVIHEGVLVECIWSGNYVGFVYGFITGKNKGKCTDMVDTWRKYEVIGNIHSNPELLK